VIALTAEEVERGYNNRAAVPDHPQWFERWAQASAEARAKYAPKFDLRYGRIRRKRWTCSCRRASLAGR